MNLSDIARLRLVNQRIARTLFTKPEQVVRHLGAIQAQDYSSALWAVGLRMRRARSDAVELALAERRIVRTWPMRTTLHFVAAEDARWMLDLMTPRALSQYGYRMRSRGIDERTYAKATNIFSKALAGGNAMSRPQLYELLDRNGLSSKNGLGLHIISRLAHEQLLCFGPRQGKQQTLVLLDEWLPRRKGKAMTRDESLRELAIRYFTSHGPAQVQDLAWWSGLSVKDIQHGIALAENALRIHEVDGRQYYHAPNLPRVSVDATAYLLPAFDEFLVAYRDRTASLRAAHMQHINPGGNGMLSPIIVIDGQVLGTWHRVGKSVSMKPFVKFTKAQQEAVAQAVSRYQGFAVGDGIM